MSEKKEDSRPPRDQFFGFCPFCGQVTPLSEGIRVVRCECGTSYEVSAIGGA